MSRSPRFPRFRWLRSPISPISLIGGRRISPITKISLVILGIFLPLALLGLWLGREKAAAAWFDDNFSYRNSIAITSHTAAENNVYISTTIDTSASGQFQADCGDLRFTTVGGDILPYYIVSGCGTATTVIHVFFQSFPAGAQTIYYYYGNPSADNGFSASDFTTEAANYAVGTIGSQEKGGAPVAYWKFDDATGTNAQDSSPNNNDGTLSGGSLPAWQSSDMCVAGGCLKFDGSSSYVSVTNSSNITGANSAGSASMWINANSISASATNTLVDVAGTGANGLYFYIHTNQKLSLQYGIGGGQTANAVSSSTLSANKWYFVSATWDSSGAVVYINGKQAGTASTTPSITIAQASTNIGRQLSGTQRYFNGFIDDVKIYNYARTAAQVKADFASRGSSKGVTLRTQGDTLSDGLVGYWKMDEASANSCTGGVNDSCDSSGNANNGAWNGDATSTAGKYGKGIKLDGTGDYTQITDF